MTTLPDVAVPRGNAFNTATGPLLFHGDVSASNGSDFAGKSSPSHVTKVTDADQFFSVASFDRS